MMHLLLEHGARLNATDKDGLTALHEAARTGEPQSLNYLLYRGTKDPAAACGRAGVCSYGSDGGRTGAYVDERDGQGLTPLMWAIAGGFSYCVRRIIL